MNDFSELADGDLVIVTDLDGIEHRGTYHAHENVVITDTGLYFYEEIIESVEICKET